MKTIALLAFLMIEIFTCSATSAQVKELKCVQITHIFPNMDSIGNVASYDTTTVSYYSYGDLRVYEFPYYFSHSINGVQDSMVIMKRYFVHDKDSVIGRVFDANLNIYNMRAHIDSATMIRSFTELHLKESFEQLKSSVVSSDSLPGRKEDVLLVWGNNRPEKMRWHLSYSNELDDMPFSLSPYIDSIKHLKLYKFIIYNPPIFIPSNGMKIAAFTNSYLMKKVDFPDKSIMNFINIYQ